MRFKLRTAVVGLAVVTILVWPIELVRRSSAYHVRARQQWYALETDEGRELACMASSFDWCRLNNSTANCDFSLSLDKEFSACRRWQQALTAAAYLKPLDPEKPARVQHHHRMYHKWMRAAARPWRSVEPDEPSE